MENSEGKKVSMSRLEGYIEVRQRKGNADRLPVNFGKKDIVGVDNDLEVFLP